MVWKGEGGAVGGNGGGDGAGDMGTNLGILFYLYCR